MYILGKIVLSKIETILMSNQFTGNPFIIFLTCSILFFSITFCSLNLYFLYKKYPNGEIFKTELIYFNILSKLYTFIAVILSLVIIFIGFELLSKSGNETDINRTGYKEYVVTLVIVVTMIYTSVFSSKLKYLILQNFTIGKINEIAEIKKK